jgi:metal-dependent amidase/aminoacylase/carboxypeptidase family protein
MFLTDVDIAELVAWRRALHREPELSGREAATARTVRRALEAAGADRIVAGLGGHGVAAVFAGAAPGPTVMLRAELDGLPIEEISNVPHRSVVAGRGHMCGHHGHRRPWPRWRAAWAASGPSAAGRFCCSSRRRRTARERRR